MRIAVGQMWQETNSFNRNPTTFQDFEIQGYGVGGDVVEKFGETSDLAGFLETIREWKSDVEFVGLARFKCWSWGNVDQDTRARMRDAFAKQLENMGDVDAVFLSLHGAMAAENEPDLTGALLQQVREVVGDRVPIVGSFDLHANITPRIVENIDVPAIYHACPHIDTYETSQRAARGLIQLLEQEIHPVTVWRKLPMITPADLHNTFTGPPAPLYRKLEQLEDDPDVLTANIAMSMPWLDVPGNGWSVVMTVAKPDAKWNREIDDLCKQCWDLREPLSDVERLSPREVIEQAIQHEGFPVVIGDGANATNSGAAGDATHLLRECLKQDKIPHGALMFLVDPEAVALANSARVGGTFDALVGASFSPEYSEPVHFRGTVERLLDVQFVLNGHGGSNLPIDMGRGAVVRSGDVTLLLTEASGPGSTPLLYETAGLDPHSFGIVVALSPAGFRAEYEPFASKILLSDCPGPATPNWSRLNFLNITRPIWPLDEINLPEEANWCPAL